MTILSRILDRAKIFGKIDIFIFHMSAVVKKAILNKILDQATFIAKNEISRMDMATVVRNDNFEQNP